MDKKNLHVEVDATLIRDIDHLADESETTRTRMIERLLREAIEARRNGSDIRSQLREVLHEEQTALLLRAVRDGGIAWRMVYQLIGQMAEWEVNAATLYEIARTQSETVISTLTDQVEDRE